MGRDEEALTGETIEGGEVSESSSQEPHNLVVAARGTIVRCESYGQLEIVLKSARPRHVTTGC